ncbi:site-specific integrase [Paraburkholderia acidiphila]|uniref:Site-specific integrase n=1 Tax=Paraburkholderia acidiphila TaxID=2571747 RepID=A0A7Z2J7Z3_9BURK|nr:site-specific integrase [Paraburkholderia acidiphila]QGZ55102.1 site-specific integrase [Paraburkholderia acidiphila]
MGKAKKGALKNLPSNWQDDMWRTASSAEWRASRPKLQRALAILWLLGCRPAEIASGITIGWANGTLVFEVKGAKIVDAGDRERGQPIRQVVFNRDSLGAAESPAFAFLADLVQTEGRNEAGIHKLVVTHDADYLYNCVVSLGKATYPAMRTRISPYVFRNQFASDLKADPTVSLEDAAKLMGHLSDYSIGKYGHAVHGRKSSKGRVTPVAVRATRPVKHSPKVDRLARFKAASAAKRKQQPKV